MRILGWREDIPVLMRASDCLIQNAGGMTCLEAIEVGLPILIFNPILGHDELNAHVMELVGAARWIRTSEGLKALLRSVTRREASLPPPSREQNAPLASTILESLPGSDTQPALDRQRVWLPRLVLVSAAAILFCFWLAFSSAGMALATKGLRLHVPGYEPPPGRISLGVKATNPQTATALESLVEREKLPVIIFSDARGAEGLYPAAGITIGVAEEPSDEKLTSPWKDRNEAQKAAVAIQRGTGEYPQYFLSAPKANMTALVDAPPHTQLVTPEEIGKAGLRPGLLVMETSSLTPEGAQLALKETLREIRSKGFVCVSLSQL